MWLCPNCLNGKLDVSIKKPYLHCITRLDGEPGCGWSGDFNETIDSEEEAKNVKRKKLIDKML